MLKNEDKHFGFLIDCPSKGLAMMFPAFVEDIDVSYYEEVDVDITQYISWNATLANSKYKVFQRKQKKKQDK